MNQCRWYLRYALGWVRFTLETNTVALTAATMYTRVWAYYWIMAAILKYRVRWGDEMKWDKATSAIDRAIRITICRGKRENREEEQRFWRRVVELAEESGKPQWIVRDMLEESPWLIDMPLRPEFTPEGRKA